MHHKASTNKCSKTNYKICYKFALMYLKMYTELIMHLKKQFPLHLLCTYDFDENIYFKYTLLQFQTKCGDEFEMIWSRNNHCLPKVLKFITDAIHSILWRCDFISWCSFTFLCMKLRYNSIILIEKKIKWTPFTLSDKAWRWIWNDVVNKQSLFCQNSSGS